MILRGTIRLLLLALTLAALAYAQSASTTPAANRQPPPALPSSGVIQIYGGGGPADPVGPGDLLEVRVFNEEQLGGQARVSTDGNIDLPFLGTVQVARQTPAQIEKSLTARYAVILKRPVISVRVLEVNSRHVSITGQVPRPGMYAYSGRVTLLEALSMAGGVDTSKAGNSVYLLHNAPARMTTTPEGNSLISVNSVLETIDLSQLWKHPELNRVLQPGDVIQVPPADLIFVSGDVLRAGEFQLRPGMTLAQAVSGAGGLVTQADGHHVHILRKEPTGTGRVQLTADVYGIQHGRQPDVALQPDDIVLVPGSGSKNIGLAVLDFFSGAGRWKVQRTVVP